MSWSVIFLCPEIHFFQYFNCNKKYDYSLLSTGLVLQKH